jgi:hypothetical protein
MFGEAWVKRCTKIGLATKKRRGTHKNSPLYYSKAELMKIKAAERANNANVFAGTIRNLLTKIVK